MPGGIVKLKAPQECVVENTRKMPYFESSSNEKFRVLALELVDGEVFCQTTKLILCVRLLVFGVIGYDLLYMDEENNTHLLYFKCLSLVSLQCKDTHSMI